MYSLKNKLSRPGSLNAGAGFTLLEILIALFIFTILSMILVSALQSVISAQSETEAKAESLRSLQMTLLLMSRDIEQTVDRAILNDKGKEEASFKGAETDFSFTHTGYANPNLAYTHSTLQRVHYYTENNALWRQTWDSLDLAPKAASHKRKLLDNVDSINFEYLDSDGRFHDNWPFDKQGQQALPRAIKMIIKLSHWGKMSQLYVIPAEPSTLQQAQSPPKS